MQTKFTFKKNTLLYLLYCAFCTVSVLLINNINKISSIKIFSYSIDTVLIFSFFVLLFEIKVPKKRKIEKQKKMPLPLFLLAMFICFAIHLSIATISRKGVFIPIRNIQYLTLSCFVFPIFEEIIFRWRFLKLKNTNAFLVILSSALFWSLSHATISQKIFTFLCGLILGFIAFNYSVFYSLLIHIMMNFIIGFFNEKVIIPLLIISFIMIPILFFINKNIFLKK